MDNNNYNQQQNNRPVQNQSYQTPNQNPQQGYNPNAAYGRGQPNPNYQQAQYQNQQYQNQQYQRPPYQGQPNPGYGQGQQRPPYQGQQPYGQQRPPYGAPAPGPAPGNGAATASLVLGIISLGITVCFGWTVWVTLAALVCSIIGVIVGVKAKKDGFVGGKLTAGIVLSIIGLVLSGIVFFSCLACVGAAGCTACSGALFY